MDEDQITLDNTDYKKPYSAHFTRRSYLDYLTGRYPQLISRGHHQLALSEGHPRPISSPNVRFHHEVLGELIPPDLPNTFNQGMADVNMEIIADLPRPITMATEKAVADLPSSRGRIQSHNISFLAQG